MWMQVLDSTTRCRMYAIVGKMSEEEEAQLINALIQGLYDGQ